MAPHRLEVADVFRKHAQAYLAENSAPVDHKRVLRDIVACRTAALGGQVKECDRCGHEEFFYKSCANRHCPKCQGGARAKWLEARASDLLETRYFHVVFTLPDKLGPLALQNKRLVYGLLFRAASETLLKIARDPKHLGADIGFLAVLHTWGQRLDAHPHVHCVVPGGGLSPDRKEWISSRKNFFVFLANCVRKERLQLARKLLGEKKKPDSPSIGEAEPQGDVEPTGDERYDVCPACKDGRLVPLREIKPDRRLAKMLLHPEGIDSS